jgi:hypothetical protein
MIKRCMDVEKKMEKYICVMNMFREESGMKSV